MRHFFETDCIRYSLNTNDYNIAIRLLQRENFKIDTLMSDLRAILMEIKNGKLFLTEDDIENIVASRLKDIQSKIDSKYFAIKNNEVQPEQLELTFLQKEDFKHSNYMGSYEEFKDEQVISFVKKYVLALKGNKRIPPTVFDFLQKTVKKNAIEPDDERPEWLDDLTNGLSMADEYAENRVRAIHTDNRNFYVPAIIERCLKYIDDEYITRNVRVPKVKTNWETVFKKFAEQKKTLKGTSKNTIDLDKSILDVIFALINKKYVETLTLKDCETISTKIYYVPKNYKKIDAYKRKKLSDVLLPEINDKALSTGTVKRYLRTFKEFLSYCQRKGYVKQAFNVQIEVPVKNNAQSYERFTKEELLKIFNPKTFPYSQDEEYAFRYYLMLLGLYEGARLNELAQLYCDDIRKEDEIYYMLITDEREDQHLKNKQSKRIIPIHPKLIEMGFIDYVMSVKAKRKQRVFYQLTYTPENHYGDKMSKWFRRYLTEIGIKRKTKVFHSFRHTVKPELRDAGVPPEYQNAICGWEGKDTGERIYGGNFQIRILYNELCKLQYPYLNDNLRKIRERPLPDKYRIRMRMGYNR